MTELVGLREGMSVSVGDDEMESVSDRGSEGENEWEEDLKVTSYWQRENK